MILAHIKEKIIKTAHITFCALILSGCELFQIELDVDDDYDKASYSTISRSEQRYVFPATATASPTSGSDAVITLLRYSRFITELSEAELSEEFEKIDASNKVENTNRGLLKMVVLLSLPKAEFFNEERAEEILNEFVTDGQNNTPALREYAHLLLTHLKQREDHIKLYDDLHKKLKLEREQRKKLQRKLDELKSIEKSITKRQKDAGS